MESMDRLYDALASVVDLYVQKSQDENNVVGESYTEDVEFVLTLLLSRHIALETSTLKEGNLYLEQVILPTVQEHLIHQFTCDECRKKEVSRSKGLEGGTEPKHKTTKE